MTTIRRPRWRTLVLGDWHPWVRDPIDVLRLTFLAAAPVMLALGNVGAALRLAGTFALLVLCRVVDPPRPFDLAFVLAMGLQAWGNVTGLFEDYYWYDKVVHFSLSFATAPLWYLLLVRLRLVPDLPEVRPGSRGTIGMVVIAFACGVAFGALYEIYEYVAVHAFAANLQIGYGDTINDLVDNAVASLLGGGLLILWNAYGWGTTRRAPEERLRALGRSGKISRPRPGRTPR